MPIPAEECCVHSVLVILAVVWTSSAVGVFLLFRKEMRGQDQPRSEAPLSVRSARYAGGGNPTELSSQNAHIALVHAEERVEEVAD